MENIKNKKNYCTIYIVRHGETEWNVKKIMQGHKDSKLTKKGINQAKDTAKRLKKIKFDKVFSSDLGRAKKTAEILALEHKLIVKTHKALRERSFGKYDGQKLKKFQEELKELLQKFEDLNDQEKFKYKMPYDNKSWEDIITRFITILREIAVAYPNKKILVVSHGGVIKFFLIHLGFATTKQLGWHAIKNTAHVKLLCDGVDFFIKETFGVHKQEAK